MNKDIRWIYIRVLRDKFPIKGFYKNNYKCKIELEYNVRNISYTFESRTLSAGDK